MDDKVTTVLDAYHELIREQEENRGQTPAAERHTSLDHRLLAVGPQTGQLINILARSFKTPNILELGTSYGYSGIWLADAARASGGRVTTMELEDYKSAFAREMAGKAGLSDYIDFKVGDAVKMIGDLAVGIDFVLLDLWKDMYVPCLEAFYPKLNPGAIIVADNILTHRADVMGYVRAIRAKPDISSVMLPVGQGIEISRYNEEGMMAS